MDPIITQPLSDLKDLLRGKVITFDEWREEVKVLTVLADERNKFQPKVLPPSIPLYRGLFPSFHLSHLRYPSPNLKRHLSLKGHLNP